MNAKAKAQAVEFVLGQVAERNWAKNMKEGLLPLVVKDLVDVMAKWEGPSGNAVREDERDSGQNAVG